MYDDILEEIKKIESRLNTIAEQNGFTYEILETERWNLATDYKYSTIVINVNKKLR